jgi:hypothetical protein
MEKKFKVYGKDLTKAIAEFDTINEAMAYAKKGLRKGSSRMIKSSEYKKWLYRVGKNWQTGKIEILDLR